jgi:hypothetical protein
MKVLRQIGVVVLVFAIAACGNPTRAQSPDVQPTTTPPTDTPATASARPSATAPATTPDQGGTAAPRKAEAQPVNPTGAAVKAFQDRIQEYVKFHNNVEKMVPRLTETSDPTKISAREKALGEQLIKSRPDAKPGDFFIKEYQPFLIKTIQTDFAKRPLADRKALIQELPKGVSIAVNMIYPTTLPLATFPGNLLKVLPELPKELEYRIVGRHLILRDVTGNVIVDVLRDVFPIPA